MLTVTLWRDNFRPAADHLAGRVVLLTGATGSIGQAVAQGVAGCGATLIIAARNVKAAEKLYDLITGHGWPEPIIYPVDLAGATLADYEQMAGVIKAEVGALDAVTHVAADFAGLKPLEQAGAEAWERTLTANLSAAQWINQAVLPLLRESDQPRIVFTLEDLHRVSRAYWGAYGVGKAALAALAAMTASEFEGYGIKVNAVSPPPTASNLRSRAYVGENPAELHTPEALVPAYLYLLGSHDRLITGEAIHFES
ncbi:MAG: SDR family NAD(P)-dependent oxidoreductase [Pseudomonadota bacterium]